MKDSSIEIIMLSTNSSHMKKICETAPQIRKPTDAEVWALSLSEPFSGFSGFGHVLTSFCLHVAWLASSVAMAVDIHILPFHVQSPG